MCFSLARCLCQTLAPIPTQPRVNEGGPSTLKEMPQHGVRKGPLFSYPHRDITRKERTSTKTCFEYQTEHYRANSIKVIMCKILKSKKRGVAH